MRSQGAGAAIVVASAAVLALSGCAKIGEFGRKRADKAAYAIIAQKQEEALGGAAEISIDPLPDEATDALIARATRLLAAHDSYTTPSHVVSLSDALAVAVANNRDYQTQKEGLYAAALSLTETRREFSPLFTASGNAGITRTETGHDTLAGATVEHARSRGFSAGVTKILATGASISLDFTHSFLHNFTTSVQGASNSLSFSIVQPLLRGAGRLVAHESLLQGERNMIYAVRTFRRFQQQFIIDAANTYYDLILAQDQLGNALDNYKRTVDDWRKLKRFASGGRASDIEVDQAYQQVLNAEVTVSDTRKSYARRLDEFKIFLGVPIDLDMGPDRAELKILAERGLLRPAMELDDAIRIALDERLDLRNQTDQVEDTRRAVKIAEQAFLPTLNAGYSYSTERSDDKDRINLNFRDNTNAWTLDLGLPFDWTPKRNAHRLALIGLARAERSLEESSERLVLDVREAWRQLEDARIKYRIQHEAVLLARRRLRSTTLNLQRGRALGRDLFDAQDALLASLNSLSGALVTHTMQRLTFWNTIERLEIDSGGLADLDQGELIRETTDPIGMDEDTIEEPER